MNEYDFKLPDIGEGITEGEVVKWLVQPGDVVTEDQPIVEVMTDKATVTITSPKSGVVKQLGGGEGAVIAVHSTLLLLELSNGQASAEEVAAGASQDGPAASAVGDIKEELPGMALIDSAATAPAATQPSSDYFQDKPLATPATRKLARELEVDLRTVPPSGRNGRVVDEDVRRAAASVGSAPLKDGPATEQPAPVAARPAQQPPRGRETRRPLKGMRKRIFKAMARSKHTAAHFTFVEECDVTRLKQVRQRLKSTAAEQGIKLSYLPFIIKAVVAALKKHPSLNSAFDEETQEIIDRGYYNIGVAAATEAGLMVPVVKNADALSMLDLAREVARLAEATRNGTATSDELGGSTFTITSLGRQGGLFATPILNPPEVGILGVHQIKQKPVVRDGEIAIGDVMLLSLSFDHRIIDGHVGAAFAYEVISYLEEPEKLWLEMS